METAITKIVIQSLKTRYLSKNKTLVQHHSPDRLQLYEIPFFKPWNQRTVHQGHLVPSSIKGAHIVVHVPHGSATRSTDGA